MSTRTLRMMVFVLVATVTSPLPLGGRAITAHGISPEIDGPTALRPSKAGASNPPEFHLVFPQMWRTTVFDSTFGASRPDGRRHQGNDLMAPKHTPVYAVADGVVSRIGDGPRSGRHLVLSHGAGWTSWYMHLNNDRPGTDDGRATQVQTYAPGIGEGSFVAAGDLIGYVGDSGNAENKGPHTHFELHHRGDAVNPHPLLLAAYERARRTADLERLAILLERVD